MNKVFKNADDAIKDVQDDAVIMIGGFGLCGIPENCLKALVKKGVNNITCISNNAGVDDFGIGLLLKGRQVKKMIASYVGENAEFERQLLSGELEVELIPQGTLATRCMAAGYGMPAIYTPAGVGTEVAAGKESRVFNGKEYLMEYAFDAGFALVKAWKGDKLGNLIYKETARNFNPLMAMGGKITIAEVEELVEPGELDPNQVHTPGIYVHRIFQGTNYEKRIEQRTVRSKNLNYLIMALDKYKLAQRIARELKDGYYVNLGIGIPTLVANYIPNGINVTLQSENGLLGMGPFPEEGQEDPDLINAGKQTITTLPGSAFFDSALSFGMIRAGKVDLTVLGAMEVSENGDIANWKIPGKMVKGMGGAMDLVASAKNIIVAMMHTNPKGESKLLPECSLPLTGIKCVKKIVTDLAVIEIVNNQFKLLERAPGVTVEEIKSKTAGKLIVEGEIPEMKF